MKDCCRFTAFDKASGEKTGELELTVETPMEEYETYPYYGGVDYVVDG